MAATLAPGPADPLNSTKYSPSTLNRYIIYPIVSMVVDDCINCDLGSKYYTASPKFIIDLLDTGINLSDFL